MSIRYAAAIVAFALMGTQATRAQLDEAKWIGSSNCALYSAYLPIYRLHCTLQLHQPSHSTSASILLGGNDSRLMNRYLNLQGMEMPVDSSYIRVEYEISSLAHGRTASINIYRAGYARTDNPHQLFAALPIPFEAISAENAYQPVALQIEGTASTIAIHVNGIMVGQVVVNPYGNSHDFIGYPQLAHIGYAMHAGQRATLSGLRVTHHREPQATLYSQPRTHRIGGDKAQLVLFDPSNHSLPSLRSSFSIKNKPIRQATLCATARGIYEARINGQKVGNEWYAPGVSQYNHTHYYQTYRIDSLLKQGSNDIQVDLAEGWWMGYVTYSMTNWNYFGDQLALRARLVVNYDDGDSTVLVTQPHGWEVSTNGPLRQASLFMGQVWDARIQKQHWTRAQEIALDGHKPSEVQDYTQQRFLPATTQVQAFDTLQAKTITESRPGMYIYDMGQNMAGVPRIHLPQLPSGTQVRIRFAEVTYPELPQYAEHTGMLMLENIRAAMAQDIYISDGKAALFEPHFTQHGYRFIEITGIPKPLPLDSVESIVVSSVDRFTAHFECSNPLVNRLWQNIQWSTLANFISLPTDCPQRNERMGWSGDIQVFAHTATYLWNCKEFLRKHLQAMRDIQTPEGRFPDVAPIGGGFGGFLWGTAGIIVPWEVWQQYGDLSILSEHYPAMQKYMDYVAKTYIDPHTQLFVQTEAEAKLGDWLGLEDNKNDKSLLFDCYYIRDLEIMSHTAALLGHQAEAERYAQLMKERKTFFTSTYIQAEDGTTIGSDYVGNRAGLPIDIQSSYVLPLAFHVAEGELEKKLMERLVATMERSNTTDTGTSCPPMSLMTGFITTSWISRVLTDNGRPDLAYRLLQNTSYPSWLYPVTQGATTIWERLNSYTHTDGFGNNNSMNSFNHYSFGAVGQWLINRCLGIERDEQKPGFEHFYLCPLADPTGEMTFARGYYHSPRGRISSSWERQEDGSMRYHFTIPPGTTATLLLPRQTPRLLREGTHSIVSQ